MSKKNIAIILAAGKGSRMNSDIPKPLHKIAGKTIIEHILTNIDDANYDESVIVINKESEDYFSFLKNVNSNDYLNVVDGLADNYKNKDVNIIKNIR